MNNKGMLVAYLFGALVPCAALAQDGGVLNGTVDTVQPADFLGPLVEAFGNRSWVLVAILAVMLLTVVARHWAAKLPGAWGAAFASRWAGWIVPLVFSTAAAVGISVQAGKPLSVATFLGALVVALGAGGLPIRAEQAGNAAAAKAEAGTVEDALKGLTR